MQKAQELYLLPNNISQRFSQNEHLHIGETSFSAGVNFLLTWQAWIDAGRQGSFTYVANEAIPLNAKAHQEALSQFPELKLLSEKLLCTLPPAYPPGQQVFDFEDGKIRLLLMIGDATQNFKQCAIDIDAWYLSEVFSQNSAEWNEQFYRAIASCSQPQTTLSCIQEDEYALATLTKMGFTFTDNKCFATYTRQARASKVPPWFCLSTAPKAKKKILIIGAGIAGCSAAYEFNRRGFEVQVWDKLGEAGAKASGNQRGMVKPLFTRDQSRGGLLSEICFAYSFSFIKELNLGDVKFGMIDFARGEEKQEHQKLCNERYTHDFSPLILGERVKELSGLDESQGVYQPLAMHLSPPLTCKQLLQLAQVTVQHKQASKLEQVSDFNWLVQRDDGETESFELVLLANAGAAEELLPQDLPLPFQSLRGQVCLIAREDFLIEPKIAFSDGMYLLPVDEHSYLLGATFQKGDDDTEVREIDNVRLIEKLQKRFPGLLKPDTKAIEKMSRCGFRCTLPDHFPVAGPIPDVKAWKHDFRKAPSFSRSTKGKYLNGLYLLNNFGARGFTNAPLCAFVLAEEICGKPWLLPVSLRNNLHPGRYLLKQLRRGEFS